MDRKKCYSEAKTLEKGRSPHKHKKPRTSSPCCVYMQPRLNPSERMPAGTRALRTRLEVSVSLGGRGAPPGPDSVTHGALERLKVSALAQQLDRSAPEHKQSEESPDLAPPADLSVCYFPSLHSWRNRSELKRHNCCRRGGFFLLLKQECPTRSSCERPHLP